MSLIELRCPECGKRIIVDEDELAIGQDDVACPYCGETIEVPEG